MQNLNVRALLLFILSLSAANAASILDVTLSPASQTGNPGQTLTFSGVLQNNFDAEVFINSNSYTFQIGDPGVLDDSLFLSNAPLSLLGLESSNPFDFFTVTIPALQAPGLYTGVFTVVGGADDLAADVIGTASFQVEVPAPATGVPEPASIVLLCGGLGWLAWTRRR